MFRRFQQLFSHEYVMIMSNYTTFTYFILTVSLRNKKQLQENKKERMEQNQLAFF